MVVLQLGDEKQVIVAALKRARYVLRQLNFYLVHMQLLQPIPLRELCLGG